MASLIVFSSFIPTSDNAHLSCAIRRLSLKYQHNKATNNVVSHNMSFSENCRFIMVF